MSNEVETTELQAKIAEVKRIANGKMTFTLESGRGATYRNNNPNLYAHDVYPRTSVLAGRPRRIWVTSWSSWEKAREVLKQAKIRVPEMGSTYIPDRVMLAGIPDEPDCGF